MAYKALVAHARVRPHPNSDNGLQIVTVNGYQVITGASIQDGELVVFFPEGGCLSPKYLCECDEYRVKLGLNRNQQTWLAKENLTPGLQDAAAMLQPAGFFEANGRIRTIRLRGEKSEGYLIRPEILNTVFGTNTTFFAGQTFDELEGHKVCWKYVSPATQRAMERLKLKGQAPRDYGLAMFHKHFDTENLRHAVSRIPNGARAVITEKLHGSSGRTGLVLVDNELTLWQQRWNRFCDWTGAYNHKYQVTQSWKPVTGTRKVVRYIGDLDIRPDLGTEDAGVRREIHELLGSMAMKGETFYYEIVGHWSNGGVIFSHGIPDDDIGKTMWKRWKSMVNPAWGRNFHYLYGTEGNQYGIYVYRITQTNEDGYSIDLSWEQIQTRCQSIGVQVVPELIQGEVYVEHGQRFWRSHNDKAASGLLYEVTDMFANGASTLDSQHVREGVCIRIEHPDMQSTFKYKGFEFCHLENIMANSDYYIDVEASS